MVFSSLVFLFHFLSLSLLLYYICSAKWKNVVLFAGSLMFYIYGVKDEPQYFLLFLLSVLVSYHNGLLSGQRRWPERRKKWLILGICYSLPWLFLFKYSGSFARNLSWILQKIGTGLPIRIPEFPPPVGISFYTSQAISYLADVYRKEAFCETSLTNYGMYITVPPQLTAGPTVTYVSVRKQIHRRSHNPKNAENGLREFTINLGFKVLLANQAGRLWSQAGTIGYEGISTPLAWPRSVFRFTLILMVTLWWQRDLDN